MPGLLLTQITIDVHNHIFALANSRDLNRNSSDLVFYELTSIAEIYAFRLPENRLSIHSKDLGKFGNPIKEMTVHLDKLSEEEERTRKIFFRFATNPLSVDFDKDGWASGYITFRNW